MSQTEKSSKNFIKAKTNEFLSNKQNAEALRTILDGFKVSEMWVNREKQSFIKRHVSQDYKKKHLPIISHLLSLEAIFVELLKADDMKIDVVPLKLQGKYEKKLKKFDFLLFAF